MARSADQEKVLEAIRLFKSGMNPPAIAEKMTRDGKWGTVNVRSVSRWVKSPPKKNSGKKSPARADTRDKGESDIIGQNRSKSDRIMSEIVSDVPTPESVVNNLVQSRRQMAALIESALRELAKESEAEDGDTSKLRYEIAVLVKTTTRIDHELAVATGVADGILAKPPTVADMSDSIADLVNAVKGVRQ